MAYSKCDKCSEIVSDLDAGFSPGLHRMSHDCGGTWRVVPDETAAAAILGRCGGKANTPAQRAQRAQPKPGAGRPRAWRDIDESAVPDGVAFAAESHRQGQMIETEYEVGRDGQIDPTTARYRRTRDRSEGPAWTYQRRAAR